MSSVSATSAEATFIPKRTSGLGKTFDEIRVFVWRNLSHIPRMPERLADVTVMPIMFVLLFGYVFGSAIAMPGQVVTAESASFYRSYLIGGIFVQSVVFMCITTAVGVVSDMKEGVIDRFRSLPISRVSVLAGRAIASLFEGGLGITVMALCGLIVGWGARNGFGNAVAGFALLAGIALAMICLGIYVGQLVKNPMTAQAIGFTAIFPLTFASNAFVPTDNMPTWLRAFAEWNPVSSMVQAVRYLFGNLPPIDPMAAGLIPDRVLPWPLQHPVLATVIWIVVLGTIGMTLAVRKYAQGKDR
ncbi:MAG: ABC transporter permease [Bauldia sp.]|nr:ABC transporter permease [Bauldia sp.]